MPQTFFYVYPCAFCGVALQFRRPVKFDRVFCGSECLFAAESDLRSRVNAVPLPRELREEQ